MGLGNHESIDHNKNEIYDEDLVEVELANIRVQSALTLFFIHFYALSKKRFIYFYKDLKGITFEIIIPIVCIVFGLLIIASTADDLQEDTIGYYNDPSQIIGAKTDMWINSGYPSLEAGLATAGGSNYL